MTAAPVGISIAALLLSILALWLAISAHYRIDHHRRVNHEP
jgi:hypothetical protein